METKETNDIGLIDWWEFKPEKEFMLVRIKESKIDKETETGIILKVQESVIDDRPNEGVIVASGNKAPYGKGNYVYWTKNGGYDLNNIRSEDEKYVLINPESILGTKVKDTR